ncbi:IS3 family transposase, partial [Bacillus sp. JJ1566]|uniref:IS3 family transposase n=1 Tax=Bacillus sp. JJ1566 TaxID=3122961 RepID=UPI002FFF994F
MPKFTVEQKMEAILRYLNGGESLNSIAKSLGMSNIEMINFWIKKYQYHGLDTFKRGYTKFTFEDKLNILKYMNENGLSIIQTAVQFNLSSPGMLRNWRISLENNEIDSLIPKKKGRPKMKKDNQKQTKKLHLEEDSLEALQAENERLRMENAYFKKVECLSSTKGIITRKDKAQVVFELRDQFNVQALIILANIKRSTYYYWTKNFERPDKYSEMKSLISSIYHEHRGRYGYRRITLELRNRGYEINHKTVYRLMKELGLKSLVRMKKYQSYKGNVGKIAPNILKRDFTSSNPNEKWVTDVTEFHLFGEKLYLSPILDLYNGEIIAYNIETRPTYQLVSKMLDKVLPSLTNGETPILHSDQGWQYQMKQYAYALKKHGITQSMSRKGNCLDNAVMENFFGLLKSELLYLQEFDSMEHFK